MPLRIAARALITAVVMAFLLAGCTTSSPSEQGEPNSPSPSEPPSPTEESETEPEPEPEPEPTTEDPLPEGPVNILLLGTDDRDPETMTGHPDTIVLTHIPADRENIYLISFTRDSWVQIPGIGNGKLNSAFTRGGLDMMHATLDELLGGVDIDFTVQSNMHGFIALTRWLGHFEVENQYATSVTVESTGRHLEFAEGRITLENTDGLIYVRQRQGMPLGDLDRTERGRAALVGMMERVQERLSEEPEAFPELVEMLYDNVNVTGEFDLADAISLSAVIDDLDADDIISLMAPITGFDMIEGQSVNRVNEAQTADLGEALRTESMEDYVGTYGTDYTP